MINSKIYNLDINDRAFKAIKEFRKKVEIRVTKINKDFDYSMLKENDYIYFTSYSKEKIICKIVKINWYKTIEELLIKEGTKYTLSSTNDFNEGVKSINSFDGYKEGIKLNGVFAIHILPLESWKFGINNNELINLVLNGKKTATTSLLKNSKLPKLNEESVIIDDNNIPKCIIKTLYYKICKFKEITSEMVNLEGEGDCSLDFYRKTHISFFNRIDKTFNDNSSIIFEIFVLIHKIEEDYYKAYDLRYKQVYQNNVLWETSENTKQIIEIIKKYNISKDSLILDLGCGEGRDSIYLLNKGYNVLAIDYSQTVINKCNEITNNKYYGNFKQLDIFNNSLSTKFDFIYSVAVLHMFITKEHRNNYYNFIYEHLKDNGISLIIVMGDGIKEYSSNVQDAFKNVKRVNINNNKEMNIVSTTCKIVNWSAFEREITLNNLEILEKGISNNIPNFDTCMYVVVKKL